MHARLHAQRVCFRRDLCVLVRTRTQANAANQFADIRKLVCVCARAAIIRAQCLCHLYGQARPKQQALRAGRRRQDMDSCVRAASIALRSAAYATRAAKLSADPRACVCVCSPLMKCAHRAELLQVTCGRDKAKPEAGWPAPVCDQRCARCPIDVERARARTHTPRSSRARAQAQLRPASRE